MRRGAAVPAAVLGAVLLAGAVAGCSSDGGTPELRDEADSGFVGGDGTIVELAEAERDAPVTLSGDTLDGEPLDVTDLRGQVVVLNVWGSWCPPCRAEAPDLVAAYDRLTTDHPGEVAFVGINISDPAKVNARRFEETFGVTYPSLYDPDGRLLLELRGQIPPSAIPSTLVLDQDGAMAARKLGPVDTATLVGMVENVLDEAGPA